MSLLVKKKQLFFFLWFCIFKLNALGVSPTSITLSSSAPIANLTLTNDRDSAMTIQISIVRWSQRGEKEIFSPTDELIVAPQIFRLQAKESRLVRVGLEYPSFGEQEKSYRLFAEEVMPKLVKSKQTGLVIAIRVSLPVIIESLTPVRQKVTWHTKALKRNHIKIIAQNKGNNVIFINKVQGLSANKQPVTQLLSTFAYILPGSKKTWVLDQIVNHPIALIETNINKDAVVESVH